MLLVLYGQTGSGKNYLAESLINNFQFQYVIRPTSRPKRDYDESDIYYFYDSIESFDKDVLIGKILLPVTFNNWRYGIFSDIKEKALDLENNYVIAGDKQMALDIRTILANQNIPCVLTEVTASKEVRYQRATKRENNPDIEEVLRRLETDDEDYRRIVGNPNLYYDSSDEKNEMKNKISFFKSVTDLFIQKKETITNGK